MQKLFFSKPMIGLLQPVNKPVIGFLYDVTESWMEINQSVKYCDVLCFVAAQQLNKSKWCHNNFLLKKRAFKT